MRPNFARPVIAVAFTVSMHAAQAVAQPGEAGSPPGQVQPQSDVPVREGVDRQRVDRLPGAGDIRGRGPGGPRFFGGPGREERKLVAKFDADKSGWLNAEERAATRKEIATGPQDRGPFGQRFRGPGEGPGFRGPREEGERNEPDGAPPRRRGFRGFGFGRGRNAEPPKPGEQLSPADVANYPDADLYDAKVLRTLFLEFENADWYNELSDFHNSDVEVPATLTVDGKEYRSVGVHFRGASSYMMVPAGYKRSLNLSLDFINEDQRLYGYRTLNLLNGHADDSLMSSVLYSHIARQYMPAPKANFVRVVINGEDWGVFASVQQFNKDFVKENYGSAKGARWKVKGSPGGDAGLRNLGDDTKPYRERFTIKSKEDEQAWRDLVTLCKTLEQTPPENLQTALEPLLDIDGTLRFLALDVALVNMDGYWVRASDYSLYQDPTGRFHLVPSDMNEAFRSGGGPRGGMRGGRGRRDDGDGNEGRRSADGAASREPREERGSGVAEERSNGDEAPADVLGDGPREIGRRDGRGFGPPGFGPPGFGGPGGGGVKLDPLVGLDNERIPLRSKLLAVPELKTRYLEYVRAIAEDSLDWSNLGPVVADYRALIRDAVERDIKKLSTFEAFLKATADESVKADENEREMSLRTFAEKRREYLLEQSEVR